MNARERILNYIEEKKEPISSQELSEKLELPKNTVYYNTTILVAAEKIKRYKGFAGIFILEKEAEDSSNTSEKRPTQ